MCSPNQLRPHAAGSCGESLCARKDKDLQPVPLVPWWITWTSWCDRTPPSHVLNTDFIERVCRMSIVGNITYHVSAIEHTHTHQTKNNASISCGLTVLAKGRYSPGRFSLDGQPMQRVQGAKEAMPCMFAPQTIRALLPHLAPHRTSSRATPVSCSNLRRESPGKETSADTSPETLPRDLSR